MGKLIYISVFFVSCASFSWSQSSLIDRLNEDLKLSNDECKILLESKDRRTKTKRIDLENTALFRHTPPVLKPYFKEDNFMEGEINISRKGAYYYLTLDIVFKSIHVKKSYGRIGRDNFLRIYFLNGENINCLVSRPSKTKLDTKNQTTVVRTSFILEPDQVESLKKLEIDKIGVIWSKGYEEYSVNYLNAIRDQLICIDELY